MSTDALARFAASVRPEDLPSHVYERATDLLVDWLGCALAGRAEAPVQSIDRVAASMGGAGTCDVLAHPRSTTPFAAAMANAGSSHAVEQDDLHNASIVHPGTVVFPAALAAAQHLDRTGHQLLCAAAVGYEVATRVGMYLGSSHYRFFHTTGTAGTLGAAAAVAHLLRADPTSMRNAIGSAGTTAAGLWQFLADGADSKPLHAAHAAHGGLMAAFLAAEGLSGPHRILEGPTGMGAAMSDRVDDDALTSGLGVEWQILRTSMKVHASCRHTHPAADALLDLMHRTNLREDEIAAVSVRVYRAAYDVLSAVTRAESVHQAKFSMGFVLAVVARNGRAGLSEFGPSALQDESLHAFAARVKMVVDPALDAAYPRRWSSIVEVTTHDGRRVTARTDIARGDPEAWLAPSDIDKKFVDLARHGGCLTPDMAERLCAAARQVADRRSVRDVFGWTAT